MKKIYKGRINVFKAKETKGIIPFVSFLQKNWLLTLSCGRDSQSEIIAYVAW